MPVPSLLPVVVRRIWVFLLMSGSISAWAQSGMGADKLFQPLGSHPHAADSLRLARRQLAVLTTLPALTRAHQRAAQALFDLQQPVPAMRHARLALQQYQHLHDPTGTARINELIGSISNARGDTGRARQHFQRALAGYQQLGLAKPEGAALELLGDLAMRQKSWDQARQYYQQAAQLWEKHQQPARAGIAWHAVGRAYLASRQFSRAQLFLRRSARLAAARHDSVALAYVLHTQGEVLAAFGDYAKAQQEYNRALRLIPPRQPDVALAAVLHESLAIAYDSLGQLDDSEQARRRALPLFQQSGNFAQLSKTYLDMARFYEREKRYRAANLALRQHVRLNDSLDNQARLAQVVELRARFETEKKEREIQLLQKVQALQATNLARQTRWRNGLALGALGLLIMVVALYRVRRRQSRINRLLSSQNRAIKRQKEELNRLNRTKDTLFSVISHDLRSPLSSLYSLLNLVNIGGIPPERLAEHSVRLSRMLNTTLQLLDNLLNWSMAQMQHESVRPKRLRLEKLAEECVELLQQDAERKNVTLINQLTEPSGVLADADMSRLILRNLLSNAIKFTAPGGTVTLSGRRRGIFWEIRIADTGVGIEPAHQEKLLRANIGYTTPGTAREKGTGLGLRLCKDFVELNGGVIDFYSQPGQGSTFWFTLPAAEVEEAVLAPAAASAAAG